MMVKHYPANGSVQCGDQPAPVFICPHR